MNWEAISAISTLVAAIVVILTAFFAIMQLNEMKRSRRLDLLMTLWDGLSSQEARANRSFVYNCLPNDVSKFTNDDIQKIDGVLSSLDRIQILIEENQIEAQFIYEKYGEIFLRLWEILYPFVLYERGRRGGYYRFNAEKLIGQIKLHFHQINRPTKYSTYNIVGIRSESENTHYLTVLLGLENDTISNKIE